MSSTVFYRFIHQKNQSTIHFDGTGINVFDLKHEIISQNQLGQGLDFVLRLYHSEQPDLEYENDQDVIPRSSFVLARRSPASQKGGRLNNAARYVTGKPRINRKMINNANASAASAITKVEGTQKIDESMSEEDKIKMMFQNQSNAWAQTQDELSTHKMVHYKPTNGTAPEDLPPPGYMCYRCGGKDHWIKNCPTNTDPNFEGKKIKRTTGIPKSYLKTISKDQLESTIESGKDGITQNEDGDLVDSKGNTYMITEEGEYVVALADNKTWLNYQEKQQNAAMKAQREFESKLVALIEKDGKDEFLDPLSQETKKPLRAPIVMTPCCQDKSKLVRMKNFNYNQQDLELLLIDNDFHCPNCNTEDVFIDSLVRNEQLEKELQEYIEKKEAEDPTLANPLKRGAEDDAEEGANKKQKTELPSKPAIPMPGMPFGMVPPGMPMMPMPQFGMAPMFMPPPNNFNGQPPK